MEVSTVVQLIVSGLTIGCVYSLVGLGFSMTLTATELINFAQGELVMLGAFIKKSGLVSFDTMAHVLKDTFANRNLTLVNLNESALLSGYDYLK